MRLRLVTAVALVAAAFAVRPAAQGPPYTFTNVSSPATNEFIDIAGATTADSVGNLYVYNGRRYTVDRITPDGRLSIVAGTPTVQGQDDGSASVATLRGVGGIAVTPDGTLFITEGDTVRRVSPEGTITTIAGQPSSTGSADGIGAAARFNGASGIAVDLAGLVYVSDSGNHTIRRIDPATGVVTTLAGSAGLSGNTDGQGSVARFNEPRGLFVSGFALLVADRNNHAIRRVALDGTATVTTVQLDAAIFTPHGITSNAAGNIYVTASVATLYRISASGSVSTLLSLGLTHQIIGDPTVEAAGTVQLFDVVAPVSPSSSTPPRSDLLVVPASGSVTTRTYVPDPQLEALAFSRGVLFVAAHRSLTRLSPAGSGAGGAAWLIDRVRAVTAASDDRAYVAAGCGILRVFPDGTPQMIAGTAARAGTSGCGAVDAAKGATDIWNQTARFNEPQGIARHASGVIYVADTGNSTIRMITTDLTVTTILGAAGVTGTTDGFGTGSRFNAPTGLALDAAGNLFIADTGNHTIRKVTTLGDVTTFAGAAGSTGAADGVGATARFNGPRGLAFAPDGTLFVADTGNSRIRMIAPSGQVTTLTGATFSAPRGVAVDSSGAVYVADTGNELIRVGTSGATTAPVMTAHPANFTGVALRDTTVSVTAAGSPAPGYRWQSSTDGVTWTEVPEFPPYRGVFTDKLTIVETPAALNGTRYRCVVANTAGSVTSAAATLTVVTITLAPSSLGFAILRPAGTTATELHSDPQTVNVTWNGSAAPWTVTVDRPWLHVTPVSGSGAGSFSVQMIAGGPAAGGPATGTVTFTSTQASVTITLPVTVTFVTTDGAPTGVLDTPANNATGLSGSIAVTGWALDDITVDRVEIWRDPVSGEALPPNGGTGDRAGKIFVGYATFVPGARPDVQALFPSAPNVYRAGWGYMLLTYGLPNQGNGTFRLYAYAVDRALNGANAGLLGTKTISIDNLNAAKPFGAIDTPGAGATVSGVVTNFGWALTPGGSCAIASPNVKVSIDSGPLQTVSYGEARSDIASAFSGYTNAAAAGGHFTLDTTTLPNGLHTIGWLVTDSCNRADGIGSRFFTVANSSIVAATALAPVDAGQVVGSRDAGLTRNGVAAPLGLASDGTRVVRVDQTERLELQLPSNIPYLAGALPLGSTFDADAGKFSWQPAAGFLGAYDLSFNAGARTERVRVVVGPPIRMIIDTPRAGHVLTASGFTIAGWAVDLASLDEAGIDTLHVWAYPVWGGDPTFVGVAKSGGRRPDVTRLYGPEFGGAGYTVDGKLAPGPYDLVVYAHSASTNTFAGADVVRVMVR